MIRIGRSSALHQARALQRNFGEIMLHLTESLPKLFKTEPGIVLANSTWSDSVWAHAVAGLHRAKTLCLSRNYKPTPYRIMIWWNSLKLRSRNPEVRRHAIEGLHVGRGSSANSRVFEVLAAGLNDDDLKVRCAAATVLGDLNDERGVDLLIPLLSSTSPDLRQTAAVALGHLRDPRAIDPLVQMLRSANPQDRAKAGAALRDLGWTPINTDDHALFEVAIGNARAAAFRGEAAVDPLVSELRHDTSFARRSAAAALEAVQDPRRVQPLLTAIRDADPSVRVTAIHALASEDSKPVVDAVLKALRDSEACVRLAAAQVLAKRDTPDFVPAFFSLVADSNFEVRLACIQYLGRFAHPQITEALAKFLTDRDSDVRLAAAKALGASRDPAAIEALVIALVDEERAIRQSAESSLNAIDPNWPHSEAAQRAAARLEAWIGTCPAWVRSSISQVLTKLRSTEDNLQVSE